MAVSNTLSERGQRYGDFLGHARYTQGLKRVMTASPNWAKMDDDQREALEMIAHKIGRILNGDPNYSDSWHDIAGYAALVDDRLSATPEPVKAEPAAPTADPFRPVRPPEPAVSAPAAQPAAPKPAAPVAPPVVSGPVKRDE